MATYVISDIHGEYWQFIELLGKIKLKDTDRLYILGDVLDRGPHPIKIILKMMKMPNVIPMMGNHEYMALKCLEFLAKEFTEESLEELDDAMVESLLIWKMNGNKTTTDEFYNLDAEKKQAVIDYLKDFLLYKELSVNGKEYLLVHAGLGNFTPDKKLEDYSIHELVWERADYTKRYFKDKFLVTGHTPTLRMDGNNNPGYIYRKHNHIAIDCGACFPIGRLAAICLDTGAEYYTSKNSHIYSNK